MTDAGCSLKWCGIVAMMIDRECRGREARLTDIGVGFSSVNASHCCLWYAGVLV